MVGVIKNNGFKRILRRGVFAAALICAVLWEGRVLAGDDVTPPRCAVKHLNSRCDRDGRSQYPGYPYETTCDEAERNAEQIKQLRQRQIEIEGYIARVFAYSDEGRVVFLPLEMDDDKCIK